MTERTDKERLDWLEHTETDVQFCGSASGEAWLIRTGPFIASKMARRDPHFAETLREAIDAAMNSEAPRV